MINKPSQATSHDSDKTASDKPGAIHIDPRGNPSQNIYDASNRLTQFVHRLNGVTEYSYDTNDRIIAVKAPNGVVTQYSYDVLGRRLSELSPDRGTVTYNYDLANNLIQMIDGRQIATNYTYDELERVSQKIFPASGQEDVSYNYDTCLFGLGYLCQVIDESGSYAYQYDAYGNVTQMDKTELGQNYSTAYQYDNGDNLTQMTYPTGRIVNIQRDGVRRIQAIDATVNGSQQSIVSNIQYRGDNQPTQCTFGNGLVDARSYDLQGRPTAQLLADGGTNIDERVYNYDANANILSRTTTPQTSVYQYDKLDRITSDQIDGNTAHQFDYDLNHNRQSKVQADPQNPTDESYFYDPSTNRLNTVETAEISTGPSTVDPQPNQSMTYNHANRWFQLTEEGQLKATYIYNAFGQRTRKVIQNPDSSTTTTIYHYNLGGALIAETSGTGQAQRDYIWQGQSPVAQIDHDAEAANDSIYYLHTDHLYTPRFATSQSKQIIWRWEGEAFGETKAEEDPDNDTILTTINLRFPGQYFDEETGGHYNYFRNYNPSTGRYVQSDPIGLAGGMNTFGYVGGNPLSLFDFLGLIYRYGGNDYQQFPQSGRPGCEQPIWAGGSIVGWRPCDEPDDCGIPGPSAGPGSDADNGYRGNRNPSPQDSTANPGNSRPSKNVRSANSSGGRSPLNQCMQRVAEDFVKNYLIEASVEKLPSQLVRKAIHYVASPYNFGTYVGGNIYCIGTY